MQTLMLSKTMCTTCNDTFDVTTWEESPESSPQLNVQNYKKPQEMKRTFQCRISLQKLHYMLLHYLKLGVFWMLCFHGHVLSLYFNQASFCHSCYL